MAVKTASGTQVFIGPVWDASIDIASEFAALAWVEVGEASSLGDFGDEATSTSFTGLKDKRVRKIKGAYDAGSIAITAGRDGLDAGQVALNAALATKFDYCVKIIVADKEDANDTNTIFYFAGPVMSGRNSIGDANNVITTAFSIGINTSILEVPRTVVANT